MKKTFSLKKTFLSLKFLYERKFEWIELFILVLRQFKAHNFRCSKLPCDGVNLASARVMLGQSTKIPVKMIYISVFCSRFLDVVLESFETDTPFAANHG